MPCYSNPKDKMHAHLVADKSSIGTTTVALESVYDSLLELLPLADKLAQANLKARLRMLTLYYFSNLHNYLVAGSSNKDELYTGYFTKYGDGGADILPLGSLVKEQVRELARFLNIPRVIIDKPPSAGLWEGQTDEVELGISYDDLDTYLLGGYVPADVKKRIKRMHESARHKRSMPSIFRGYNENLDTLR